MRAILILLLAGSCLAGTRYEGADSTDGRYWVKCRDFDNHVTYYTPRPEAWEMVRVDTCGWKWPVSQTVRITKDGYVNLASLIVADTCLDLPVPLLDSIYAPKYLLLEGPDGPTWITAAQRDRLLGLLDTDSTLLPGESWQLLSDSPVVSTRIVDTLKMLEIYRKKARSK